MVWAGKPVMEGEGGREEDGPKPGKRGGGKGPRPGWKVLFMACLLCSASKPGKPEVDEQGQGEVKPADTKRNAQPKTNHDTESKTNTSKHNGQKKKGKQRRKRKTKALARWFSSLFEARPAQEDMDRKWTWGVPMTTEERLRYREEARRRERACLEAYCFQQAKEEARQGSIKTIQRNRKAKEAALQTLSSLPPRAEEDTARPVNVEEVISDDSWTRPNREMNKQKWIKLIDGMLKAQIQKDVEEDRRRKMARLPCQYGHESTWTDDLMSVSWLILAVAILSWPMIWILINISY